MSILPLTVPPKNLAQTISSTALSFKLNNIQSWNGTDLTPGDFGTEAFAVLINLTRTQIEIVKIDPATIADASITITARGLDYLGSETSDTSRQYAWASNETIVQLGTDAPQLFRDFMSESNVATVTALHTYDVLPQSAVAPSDGEDLVNKDYVDGLTEPSITIPINQAAHGFSVGNQIRISGVNTYALAQADSAVNAEVVGHVTEVVDVDNFVYVTEGVITEGVPVFAAGTVVFLDPAVAGGLTDTDTTTIGEVSYPLGVISESGVRMIYHKFRPLVINTIAGNPIASETVAGTVEEATQAQHDAKTAVGETGAKLFTPPNKFRATNINDFVVDTGAADAYVIAPSPAITAYSVGQIFFFQATNANTGASTLNVNGIGTQDIKKDVSLDLEAGNITAGQMVTVIYDGTDFQIVTPIPGGGSSVSEQTFTASGTWTKPANLSYVRVRVWGAGGGAGSYANSPGGGGGAYNEAVFLASELSASESVVVGAGGAINTAGGVSSFAGLLFAYGGGPGSSTSNMRGGGGGGIMSAGSNGQGGKPQGGAAGNPGEDSSHGGAGGGASAGEPGGESFWGGAGGGGYGSHGGDSVWGGGGGAGETDTRGTSIFGGDGGPSNGNGVAPGGGGGGNGQGARGEVIIEEYFLA